MADTTTLIDGLYFGEGPRWHEGRLWFSDFYDHAVKSVDVDGDLRIELELDDQPSGLGWLPDGSLLVVAMKARKLMRHADNQLTVYADLNELTAHLCNDMVVDGKGRAWVGNFGFDLDTELQARGTDVLLDHPTTNLVRVDTNGSVHLAAPVMHFPNGMVVTPDGGTLIVAETLGGCLTAFDIGADGTLSNRRLWAQLEGVAPDGICLNSEQQVWVANALGAEVLCVAEGGQIVQRVETSQFCYACMLGGDAGNTLFAVTAASSDHSEAGAKRSGKIETVLVSSAGVGWP
ncbi:MAG: SMP-30/gluconolactonase/LRE family protein [Halieaceae bacterium]